MDKYRDLVVNAKGASLKLSAEVKLKHYVAELDKHQAFIRKARLAYIRDNPSSCISAEMLFYLDNYVDFDSMKLLYNRFSIPVKESRMGQMLFTAISKKDNTQVGKIAPDFEIKDINNQLIRLAVYKGKKTVLLEFWASWCVPCRAGFPFLKDIFKQYNGRGLEIIAVSRDFQKEDWLKAIAKDSISNWRNCSVFENYSLNKNGILKMNEIEHKYYIPAIPFTTLIGSNGIIAGFFVGKSEENDREISGILISK